MPVGSEARTGWYESKIAVPVTTALSARQPVAQPKNLRQEKAPQHEQLDSD